MSKMHFAHVERGNESNPHDEWGTTACGRELDDKLLACTVQYVTCKQCLKRLNPMSNPLRKPSEMTQDELDTADKCLPWPFNYTPDTGIECEVEDESEYSVLPMKDLKELLDYLTSINVDPYAD